MPGALFGWPRQSSAPQDEENGQPKLHGRPPPGAYGTPRIPRGGGKISARPVGNRIRNFRHWRLAGEGSLGRTQVDAVLVRGIVTLAHTLNLSVVAEGIETAPQLAALAPPPGVR